MTGATRKHDRIVVNAFLILGARLGRCELVTADVAVITRKGNGPQTDLGIDCGRYDAESHQADAPTVVIEVMSPSTPHIDLALELDEYRELEPCGTSSSSTPIAEVYSGPGLPFGPGPVTG